MEIKKPLPRFVVTLDPISVDELDFHSEQELSLDMES
jgi:hypothetical protein